jgi:hypothetical protein
MLVGFIFFIIFSFAIAIHKFGSGNEVHDSLRDDNREHRFDHPFTPYTASLFAAEVAKAILENETYEALPKTPVKAVFADNIFTVTGWEHARQVETICGTTMPHVYKPYYERENIRVTAEGGWKGQSISVSPCDIQQVTAASDALGR